MTRMFRKEKRAKTVLPPGQRCLFRKAAEVSQPEVTLFYTSIFWKVGSGNRH
jgi:hypothetical protein